MDAFYLKDIIESYGQLIGEPRAENNGNFVTELTFEFEPLRLPPFAEREADDYHTAWQWLSKYQKKPVRGAEPKRMNLYFPEAGELFKDFYYYASTDVKLVSKEEFLRLKQLFIAKFGDWEKIDIMGAYDGRIWWPEED